MPRHLNLLLKLLLMGLLSGQVFRIALLLLHRDQWHDAESGDVLIALFDRGLLFDLYVISWMLMVPLLLLGTAHALGGANRWAWPVARWCFTIPFTLWLFLACADIPYFGYTNMRITDAALVTLHDPAQALKELLTTPGYLGALLLFVLAAWGMARATRRLFQDPHQSAVGSAARRWLLLTVPLMLLFLGMRGSADPEQHPLIAQDAFFSDTPFLNQLGTNAAFSFLESVGQDHMELMDDGLAIAEVRAELGIEEGGFASPIARMSRYDAPPRKLNVVLVLMESLSAQRLHRFGHPKQLMPSLELLMDSSLTMDRFFSSGMHTANGIFSSLYGFPPIGAQHPMMHPSMTAQRFHGLPGTLLDSGYRTCFIGPGDPRFDNLKAFLPENGFEELVSEGDFPATDARNSWGVTDHALYRMALRKADHHHLNSDAPFLLTLLTVSSHKWSKAPNDIPGFAPTSTSDDEAVYEYADRALAEFVTEARTRAWFDSTLLVIVGDHGQAFDPLHEVPIAYHHVPLVIHAPAIVAPGRLNGYGTQVDLPETILALLRIPHVNNTLGKDLVAGGHTMACFCADHRICAINDQGYLIRDRDVVRLYDHRDRGTRDLSAERPALRDSLMKQAVSMMQATEAIISRKLAGDDGTRPIAP